MRCRTQKRVDQEQTFTFPLCMCVCMCVLPDGSFGYRAIHQGAQTSVQTPDPMAVHCLLHAVNCSRLKRCSGSVMNIKKKRLHLSQEKLSVFQQPTVCFVCRTPVALADKHRLCQSSQGLVKITQTKRFAQVCPRERQNRLSKVIRQQDAKQSFYFS